jgi:hypothetical protein
VKKATFVFSVLYATASLAALGAGSVAAQVPGVGVRLVPKVGMYRPLGDLTELAGGAKTKDHLSVGIGAELKLPIVPINVRANVEYLPHTDVMSDADVRVGSVSMTNLVADLMFRPLPGIIPVSPYLFAGGGVKKYDFRDFSTAILNSSDNSTEPALHVGAGVEFKLGVTGLVVEVGDYISRFERAGKSKLQNDGFASLGVRVGLL